MRRLCLVALALLGLLGAASLRPSVASAAPQSSAVQTFSVEASATSVSLTSPIGYSVTVRLRRATPSLRVRLRIYTSGGWLLYQKTEYVTTTGAGRVRVNLSRPGNETPIEPGIYRAEITVRTDQMAQPLVREVPLRVYSAKTTPVPVVLCLRVTGPPMTDPQGRFVVDPAEPNAAFDAAVSAADLVLGDVRVRLSVAVPPVLLREWRQITEGYRLVDQSGVAAVATSAPAPIRYADGLGRIRAAVATGRLELLSLGFADPNVSWLAREGLIGDIAPQYALGTQETSASLSATPVAGTAVAGSCVPQAVAGQLKRAGVRWLVLDQGCALLGKAVPPSGPYRTGVSGVRALVADSAASKAVRSGNATSAVALAFRRFLRNDAEAVSTSPQGAVAHDTPFVLSINVGPGMTDIGVVAGLVDEVSASPWAKLITTRQALDATSPRKLSLRDVAPPDRAPIGYWEEVAKADEAARSLFAALGPEAPDALEAKVDALTAESSSFAGADRSWALADRGRAFSAAASRRAQQILGGLRLSAPDVTLSGSAGEVPVTIRNPTRRILRVVFLALDGENVVKWGGRRELLLRPGDTYLTLKVDLRTSLSSTLKLAVRAGGTNLDTDTVMIRASYLDRLAIIGGVLALLVGLLVFIVMRVRAAEPGGRASTENPSPAVLPDAAQAGSARYTEHGSGEHDPEVSDAP